MNRRQNRQLRLQVLRLQLLVLPLAQRVLARLTILPMLGQ
jgi:hypothetical protein